MSEKFAFTHGIIKMKKKKNTKFQIKYTYIKYRHIRDCQQTEQRGHSSMLDDPVSKS